MGQSSRGGGVQFLSGSCARAFAAVMAIEATSGGGGGNTELNISFMAVHGSWVMFLFRLCTAAEGSQTS